METLCKEIKERMAYLESLEQKSQTEQTEYLKEEIPIRIKELTLAMVRVQQLILDKRGSKYETVNIQIGQIFEVDGKKYIIALPKNDNHIEMTNEHGHIVCPLHEIE